MSEKNSISFKKIIAMMVIKTKFKIPYTKIFQL